MPKKIRKATPKKQKPTGGILSRVFKTWANVWQRSVWNKILIIISVVLLLFVGSSYALARWYMSTQASKPTTFGVTFIPSYSRYLGVEPKETMSAMINDLGIKHFRLVSYWNKGEPKEGVYDFSELDWQFKMAEESGSKVSLAIGLRQPRWPECHWPAWAQEKPIEQWSQDLNEYMEVTIDRYKNSPALESYQLENEFFMDVFGICPDFTRGRLINEYNLVKKLDPAHPVIISRSNNIVGVPVNEPIPDVSAVSVYKRVWDKYYTHRYLEYPFPAWFYATLGGAGKILNGKELIIHELQAEPWLPEGYQMNDPADLPEQDKSLSPERMKDRIEYAKATGIKEIYLWGAEWWYWRKVKANDPSVWNVVKEEVQNTNSR